MKRLQYAGQVYDTKELSEIVKCVSDLRIAAGPYVDKFEKDMVERLRNYKGQWLHGLAVNSGSSANLLAISSLTSAKLDDLPNKTQNGRRAKAGDEVITVACCFPTTIAPIIQNGMIPVFVDIDIPSYNINIDAMKEALTPKTVAVVIAHTLGNPFNVSEVVKFCRENALWLIEDNCDSLGSRYLVDGDWKNTGTFGDISTMSFYPPHHITTGEGGMVITGNAILHKIIKSLRDWGRDCYCAPGSDNACLQRFNQVHGELPHGYDHKYVYSHLGYNLKMVEPCGALGVIQLQKLDEFIKKRKRNWERLKELLKDTEECFVLPEASHNSDPSWFSFMLLCRNAGDRNKIVKILDGYYGIHSRPLFTGNILKHSCMTSYSHNYRVVGRLDNSDNVMENGFMIGVYPGLSDSDIDYMADSLHKAVRIGG